MDVRCDFEESRAHVVGRHAQDRVARGLPDRFLASVLSLVLVERAAIDLDDQVKVAPREVRLRAGDLRIQVGHRSAGVAEKLECKDFSAAACAIHWQTRVPRDRQSEPTTAATTAMPTRQRIYHL